MQVRSADLIAESARLSSELLSGLGRRWAHVQAVAGMAERLRSTVSPNDGPVLVAAAWLHDIGYAPEVVDTGFHPLDGARYLKSTEFPDRVINLVAHHSGACFEAVQRGLTDELAEFPREDSDVMDALVAADLTRGPGGHAVRYRERVEEILYRYPPDDPVHRTWLQAAEPLETCIEWVQSRLSAYPMNGSRLPSR